MPPGHNDRLAELSKSCKYYMRPCEIVFGAISLPAGEGDAQNRTSISLVEQVFRRVYEKSRNPPNDSAVSLRILSMYIQGVLKTNRIRHGLNRILSKDQKLILENNDYTPVGTPGFKPRIHPPYPQRVLNGATLYSLSR